MKVKELMTPDVVTCSSHDSLAHAAMLMWNRDCGVLPVVVGGRVEGVITDRDICMALFLKGERPAAVKVAEVVHGKVHSCAPDDDVAQALAIMRDNEVRRLPVIDDGALCGLLSINDVVLAAAETGGEERRPTCSEVVDTIRAVCVHRPLPAA